MTGSGDGEPLPFDLTETDRQNLAPGDAQFKPLAWDDLKEIIGTWEMSGCCNSSIDLSKPETISPY